MASYRDGFTRQKNNVYTDQDAGGNAECVHIRGERSQVGLPASEVALKPSDVAPWFGRE